MRPNSSSVFKWVVDDVISKVKPEFVQEGVEESVLDELRRVWEAKLLERGLIAGNHDDHGAAGPSSGTMGRNPMPGQGFRNPAPQGMGMGMAQPMMQQLPPYHPMANMASPLHHLTPQLAQQMLLHMQLAANNRLVKAEPAPAAAAVGVKRKEPEGGRGAVPQHDGPADVAEEQPDGTRTVPQHDGPEDGGAAGGGGKAAEAKGEAKGDAKGGEEAAGDEVLSEDSGAEEEDEGEISNYLCCQFEKVTRVKNKWKINVRDGVFHMNGQDYLFKKATGEWSWT